MKYLIISLVLILFSCSRNEPKGLEVYLVNYESPNIKSIDSINCRNCLQISKDVLFDKPIIKEDDIDEFNWEDQQIILNESGLQKILKLDIPLHGTPAAFVIDGEPIYGFWFWNMLSSIGCDRVYTNVQFDFKLKFGHMDPYGEDPRENEQLKEYVDLKLATTKKTIETPCNGE